MVALGYMSVREMPTYPSMSELPAGILAAIVTREIDPPEPSRSGGDPPLLASTNAPTTPASAPSEPAPIIAHEIAPTQSLPANPLTAPRNHTLPAKPNPLAVAGIIAKPKRDAMGRLLPGQSANRSGRPKGVAALAKAIQEKIGHDRLMSYAEDVWLNREQRVDDNGDELFYEDGEPVYQRANYSQSDRWQAFQWLSERGWGKPVIAVDINAMVASATVDEGAQLADAIDIDNLTDEELVAYARLSARLNGQPDPIKGSDRRVLDVQAVERVSTEVSTNAKPSEHQVSEVKPSDAILSEDRTLDAECTEMPEAIAVEAEVAPADVLVHKFTTSTNILGFEHDARTLVLRVTFRGERVYDYANVTRDMCREWIAHPSAGQWFTQVLKGQPQRFPAKVVSAGPART